MSSPLLSRYFLPLALYLLFLFFFYHLWFTSVDVPWGYFQILDKNALTVSPLRSIFLLNSQPPILNSLLAIVIQLHLITGASISTMATGIFYFLGAISTILFYQVLLEITKSRTISACLIAVMLADPGYHIFQNKFFYPFIIHFILIVAIFAFNKLIRTQKLHYLYATLFPLALLSNTQSLFHPLWALITFAIIIYILSTTHGAGKLGRNKHVWGSAIMFIVLLFAWPTKNLILFDKFTYTSWEGYNLARGTPVKSDTLNNYLNYGIVPKEVKTALNKFERRFGAEQIQLLAGTIKSDGTRNWNNYVLIDTDNRLTEEALKWRIENPEAWFKIFVTNYLHWTRATYRQSYTDKILGPTNNRIYLHYARIHSALFFSEIHLPDKFNPDPSSGQTITIFGAVTLPIILALLVFVMAREWVTSRRHISADMATLALTSFIFLWDFFIPCLTDGAEGNRMRFYVTPCLIIMTVIIGKTFLSPKKLRRYPPTVATC